MANDKLNCKKLVDWQKVIFFLPLALLWALPLVRGANFVSYALGIERQEQSLNASNDVHYAIALLVLYSICLAMDFALCLLFARRSPFILLLLLSAPIWVVIKIIQFRPEEVVVLVPSLNPLWPIAWHVIPLLVGLSILGFKKLETNSFGNARTN